MTERLFVQADLDREVPQPTNVIPIGRARVCRPPQPHRDTVDLLERVLERARRGDVIGIALATAYRDGSSGTGFTWGDGGLPTLYTALWRLRLRIDDWERSTD